MLNGKLKSICVDFLANPMAKLLDLDKAIKKVYIRNCL
jgi:hypothetical protein